MILKTTDGGLNWTDHSFGSTDTYQSIRFYDANTGWIVGHGGSEGGLILSTSDGGDNWEYQSSGTLNMCSSVCFLN